MAFRGERRVAVWLYAAEFTFFMTHEVDSGRWAEWKLFGIGGPELFVLIHLPLVFLLLWGFERLIAGARAGYVVGLFPLAAIGFAAMFIHGYYLLTGYAEFETWDSLFLIAAMFATSLPLAAVSIRGLRS